MCTGEEKSCFGHVEWDAVRAFQHRCSAESSLYRHCTCKEEILTCDLYICLLDKDEVVRGNCILGAHLILPTFASHALWLALALATASLLHLRPVRSTGFQSNHHLLAFAQANVLLGFPPPPPICSSFLSFLTAPSPRFYSQTWHWQLGAPFTAWDQISSFTNQLVPKFFQMNIGLTLAQFLESCCEG